MSDPKRDVQATVRIHALAHGGAGVGRSEDPGETRVHFIDGALIGERVRAAIDGEHKRWLRGHVLEVLDASEQRVDAPCPLAERCGGCSWQHVDPRAQAPLKLEIVRGQLSRKLGDALTALGPAAVAAIDSPTALHYRRRARVHYRRRGEALELGFFGSRSREVVDHEHCPVLDPALDWALQLLRGWSRWLPERGEAVGLSNGTEVVLGLPGVRAQAALLAAIREAVDGSEGAAARAEHAGHTPPPVLLGVQLRGGRERAGVGRTWLELDGDGPTPPVAQGPFSFSQAQAGQNRQLVEHVAQMARGGRILELHAGVGNFTRKLARVGRRVWAVERDREAVANLQRTAERWGLPINAKRGQAERLLAKLAAGDRGYDVVVLDPPRAGIGEAAARDLARVARERVVYVSCDPATLTRDLAALLEDRSWRLADLRVFDMMPMTAEVEVVATLVRGTGP